MTLLQLFGVFASLSLLGFGGGNAIVPQMHNDVVERFHWLTSQQFTQFYAVGRRAPGPTTMICAMIGFVVAGLLGAIVATVAMYVPGAILVGVAGKVWRKMGESPVRTAIAAGLTPVTVGLMWSGAVTIGRGAIDSYWALGIAALACAGMLGTRIKVPFLILFGAVAGLFLMR